ncbi:MAG: hypothetical protein LBQ54_02430, partial [Planctomycetaceae bacterium]|nr:hypothetical protein [Planctomycetaceae bacterium]
MKHRSNMMFPIAAFTAIMMVSGLFAQEAEDDPFAADDSSVTATAPDDAVPAVIPAVLPAAKPPVAPAAPVVPPAAVPADMFADEKNSTVEEGLAVETASESGTVETFTDKDGTTYFAFGVKASVPATAVTDAEVAILVETSTTQTGQPIQTALEVLDKTLAGLPKGTKVQLFSADVQAVSLTKGFVATDDPVLKQAVADLKKVTPLGATDLAGDIQTAVKSFAPDSKAVPVILYIGSGRSDAKLMDADAVADLTFEFQTKQIPVNFYAVGEAVDYPALGVLANQSGGLVVDSETVASENAGALLVSAVTAPVFWLKNVESVLPENTDIYPAVIPPVRTDRETILVGKTEEKLDTVGLKLELESKFGETLLSFNGVPAASDDFNAYLRDVVSTAEADQGCTLITAGRDWLERVKNDNIESNLAIRELADQAKEVGAEETAAAIETAMNLGTPAAGSLLDQAEAAEVKKQPGIIDKVVYSQALVDTQLTKEINHTLAVAGKMMKDDPDGAQNILRLSIQQISQETVLSPEKRRALVNRLENLAKEASRESYLAEVKRQQARERYFANIERTAIYDALESQTKRISAIMRRYSALMAAKDYVNAGILAQSIRDEARRIGDTAPAMGAQIARWTNTLDLYETYKVQRDIGIVDNVINLHRTNVPISDDHVLVYPEPEIWTLLSETRRKIYNAFDLAIQTESEKKITKSYDQITSLESEDTPLSDILDQWAKEFDINVMTDTAALSEAGIDPASLTVSVNASGIKFRSLLKLVLSQHGLACCIKDEVLLITTKEIADEYLVTKVYPIADLAMTIPAPQLRGTSSGGYGNSSGGGYGNSGGYGGSSGGYGNSGGGYGGGNRGWNVPSSYDNLIRNNLINNALINQRPLDKTRPNVLFNVIDERPADGAKVRSENGNAAAEKRIRQNILSLAGGKIDESDPEAVWNAVFGDLQPSDNNIRYAASSLMKKESFRMTASLIYRAIQKDQAETWMTMLLPMALEAAGAPIAEQERALLSTAPYQVSPMERLSLGASLEKIGAKERAMQFYHETSKLAPELPDPYIYAVRLAEELNDDNAKKWVSLGIAAQDWQGREVPEVYQRGRNIYQGLLEKMRSENRTEEADAYEAAMKQAQVRDCVVVLEYVGDADVELMVKEPAQTICWYNQPRTTSGGFLVSSKNDPKTAVKKKTYVCPEAFSGKYEVLAKKFWGTVPSGKVSVRVITHWGTDSEASEEQSLPLHGENGAVKVVFDLKDGRRTGSLEEAIVNNAVREQQKVRDMNLLSKKIVMESSHAVLADTISSSDSTNNAVTTNPAWNWWLPQTAVGYSPQITTIPVTASLEEALAVVSADRCYVRVTPNPLFSQILDVFTYNTMDGSST